MIELFETICVIGAGLGFAGICTEILLGSRRTKSNSVVVEPQHEVSLIERGFSGKTSLAAAIQASRQARTHARVS